MTVSALIGKLLSVNIVYKSTVYKITFTKVAQKAFAKLESDVQEQLANVLDHCKEDPFQLDCKKLKKPLQGYRVRSDLYRVLFVIESDTIVVYAIRHRKDAYKR